MRAGAEMSNIHPACKPISEAKFNVLTVRVEKEGSKFNAKLHIIVQRPYTKEISLVGPMRDTKPEAVRDGMELGKRYVVEGEAGARTVLLRLKKKKWSSQEVKDADEKALDSFVLPGLQGNHELAVVEEKLLPPGEGWCRHSEDMLVHPLSQVFFVQTGSRAGKYLRRSTDRIAWEDIVAPHAPQEHPFIFRAASASCVRRGGKLDRAVLLNDITRIARLALKIPLSFVDRPACAYAVFQGLRSAESAQWCAENFHKKLLQRLAKKIHTYDVDELQEILRNTIDELDEELLRSSHAFSGCSALIALILGNKLSVAGVGQVRAVLLPDIGPPRSLLACAGSLDNQAERERIQMAGGVVRGGIVHRRLDDLDDAARILCARNVFDVLMIEEGGPSGEKQVRSAYRKLALRVHPDKQAAVADINAFKAAFARLDSAKDSLESMLMEDADVCRELCRVLRSEVHTRAGAASLLRVDKAATVDTEEITKEAERACKELIRSLTKMQQVAPDYSQAVAVCNEAVETIRRGCTPEALPRQEALLKEGISTGRAMGVRDLRHPCPIVVREPETASWCIPVGTSCRLGILCGATAALSEEHLVKVAACYKRQPKASALRWCLDADMAASSSTAVCVSLVATGESEPPTKKNRISDAGPEGTIRIRHILLRHQQLKQPDPMARREAVARNAQEAEEAALRILETLMQDPNQFLKLCREHSECQSGAQPGILAGDLGWLGRGQQEQILEEAIFALGVKEFSDVVTGSRGIHIVQRLA